MLHSKRNENKRSHQWAKEAVLLQEWPVSRQGLEEQKGAARSSPAKCEGEGGKVRPGPGSIAGKLALHMRTTPGKGYKK